MQIAWFMPTLLTARMLFPSQEGMATCGIGWLWTQQVNVRRSHSTSCYC